MPRPFLDIEEIVADDREAALESDFDAGDRRSHQRDGDDADDHAESGEHRAHFVSADHLERDAEGLVELVDHMNFEFRISNISNEELRIMRFLHSKFENSKFFIQLFPAFSILTFAPSFNLREMAV